MNRSKGAKTGVQGTGLSAAINELYDCPIVLNNDIDHLNLSIRESFSPTMIIALVGLHFGGDAGAMPG